MSGVEGTETVNYRTGTRHSWKPVDHTSSSNQSCEKHREYERMVKQKKKKKRKEKKTEGEDTAQ